MQEFERAYPGVGLVRRFAEYVGVDQNYISQVKTKRKGIGEDFSTRLERAFKRRHGWMDQEHPWWEPRDPGEWMFLQSAMRLVREIDPEHYSELAAALDNLHQRYRLRR